MVSTSCPSSPSEPLSRPSPAVNLFNSQFKEKSRDKRLDTEEESGQERSSSISSPSSWHVFHCWVPNEFIPSALTPACQQNAPQPLLTSDASYIILLEINTTPIAWLDFTASLEQPLSKFTWTFMQQNFIMWPCFPKLTLRVSHGNRIEMAGEGHPLLLYQARLNCLGATFFNKSREKCN